MGSAWVGGGKTHRARQPLIACGGGEGEGKVRVTVLALNATWMHVDLSFAYLRSAEAASFDKKNSTGTAQYLCIYCCSAYFPLLHTRSPSPSWVSRAVPLQLQAPALWFEYSLKNSHVVSNCFIANIVGPPDRGWWFDPKHIQDRIIFTHK